MLQDTGRWTGMYRDDFTRVVTGIDIKRLGTFQTIIDKADALDYSYPRPAQLGGLETDDAWIRETMNFAATVVKRQTTFDQKDCERGKRCLGVAPPPPAVMTRLPPPPTDGPPSKAMPSASSSSSTVFGNMLTFTARDRQTQAKATIPKSTPATSKARGPEI